MIRNEPPKNNRLKTSYIHPHHLPSIISSLGGYHSVHDYSFERITHFFVCINILFRKHFIYKTSEFLLVSEPLLICSFITGSVFCIIFCSIVFSCSTCLSGILRCASFFLNNLSNTPSQFSYVKLELLLL